MKLSNILKSLVCPLLFSAICVQAEFVEECLEVKDITFECEVNSQGKIDSV